METSEKAARRKLPVKVLVFAGACLVIVLALGFAAYKFATRNKVSPKVSSAVTQAQKVFDKGDYGESYDQLVAALPDAKTKAEKIKLYNQIALAAGSSGKVTEGIKYFEMKHELDPGSRGIDGYNLGTLYDRNGETAKAIAEYKTYMGYLKGKPMNMQTRAETEALEATIAEMEKR